MVKLKLTNIKKIYNTVEMVFVVYTKKFSIFTGTIRFCPGIVGRHISTLPIALCTMKEPTVRTSFTYYPVKYFPSRNCQTKESTGGGLINN